MLTIFDNKGSHISYLKQGIFLRAIVDYYEANIELSM